MNSKIIPRFCLSHSFCRLLFSPLLSSLILLISILCFFAMPFIYLDLITLLFQEKAVSIVTELINHNQPMFIPPLLTCLKELISMNTLYPGLVGIFFIFFFCTFLCLIFAFAQASHGGSLPTSLSFM